MVTKCDILNCPSEFLFPLKANKQKARLPFSSFQWSGKVAVLMADTWRGRGAQGLTVWPDGQWMLWSDY